MRAHMSQQNPVEINFLVPFYVSILDSKLPCDNHQKICTIISVSM